MSLGRLKKFEVLDNIVHKTLYELFGDLIEIEKGYPSVGPNNSYYKVAYKIYEDGKSEPDFTYLTFTYSLRPTTIKVEYKNPFNFNEDFTKVIVVPTGLKSKEELEKVLRREIDEAVDPILRKIKLKQAIKQKLQQQYSINLEDRPVKILYDDGYNARIKTNIMQTTVQLLITYQWDKVNKKVIDVNILSIEVYTTDQTMCELIFNAVLSYYLLS